MCNSKPVYSSSDGCNCFGQRQCAGLKPFHEPQVRNESHKRTSDLLRCFTCQGNAGQCLSSKLVRCPRESQFCKVNNFLSMLTRKPAYHCISAWIKCNHRFSFPNMCPTYSLSSGELQGYSIWYSKEYRKLLVSYRLKKTKLCPLYFCATAKLPDATVLPANVPCLRENDIPQQNILLVRKLTGFTVNLSVYMSLHYN